MKQSVLITGLLLAVSVAMPLFHVSEAVSHKPVVSPALIKGQKAGFTVSTPNHSGFWTKAQVYNGFGCTGQNQSPELHWTHGPAGTKSYAVTIFDPDAPTGSGWWHWTLTNIPAGITHIPAGGPLPAGSVEGRTDYGSAGFGGACPPAGDKAHRYVITVWALNVAELSGITSESSGALVGFMVNQHKLGKAITIVKYHR